MTKKQTESMIHWLRAMESLGFSFEEAHKLRRIEMTLHRWHERECGDGNGCIERDEQTGKAYWLNSYSGRRFAIRDMEKGALKRLKAIMASKPGVWAYVQGDPRGCALYVGRNDQLCGLPVEQAYSRGYCANY